MNANQPDSGHDRTDAKPLSVNPYEVDVRTYVDALFEGKFRILLVTAAVTLLAVLYLAVAPPIYSSNVLLQFADKDSTSGVLGEISNALLAKKSAAETEVEIFRSRRILGSTIDQLSLDIIIKPSLRPRDGKLTMESLELGSGYMGKKLTLQATGKGKYRLLAPDGSLLLEGEVGEIGFAGEPGAKNGKSSEVEILVSALDVEAGSEFKLSKKPLQRSMAELSKKLIIKEEGKGSNVFKMSLEGKNARQVAAILNTIIENYFAFDIGRKSSEIQHMIDFVRAETESTKSKLEQAETRQVEYLFSHNSTGLSTEVTKLVNRLVSIESQITDLEIQKVGSASKYTENHPVILGIERKIELLASEKSGIEQRLKQLPEEEREREALVRDVEAAKQLYILLQSKQQELNVALSGITSDIQIIDHARVSPIPVKPKRWLVLAKAVLLGFFLGLVYVIGRRALSNGIEDPDVIENELNLPVAAVIAHSRLQARLERDRNKSGGAQLNVLATRDASDPAIEGLRGLCANIRLFDREGLNNIINISSPAPDTGASFIGENLAQILADSGMNVLVVDGDLRWGKLDRAFGASQAPGLGDYLLGKSALSDLAQRVSSSDSGSLDFIGRGTTGENHTELLMKESFADFVQKCSESWEMVLFVTPPVTAYADGLIVSRYADRNFLVVRYGKQSGQEIMAAQKACRNAGVSDTQVIFNGRVARARGRFLSSYDSASA